MPHSLPRRSFLKTTALTATATAVASSARAAQSPNDKVRVAVLGVNGRGRTHIGCIEKASGAEVALLCDPDSKVLAREATAFEKTYGRKVATESDLRKVFDRRDIDAVTVATPNHWHALATIWACQAGKDVYCEKPGSHNLFEGRKMVEAADKYERIVQHGVQLRSNPVLQEAVQKMRNGVIGDVYMARAIIYRWRPSIKKRPDAVAPATLDWNLWQGPAEEQDYSPRYVHYDWHWTWTYGNGDIGNQGVHETDMALWGMDLGLPSEITSMGGKFLWNDDKETPEVLASLFRYPKQNKLVQVEVRPWCTNQEAGIGVGNLFYGSEGVLTVDGYNGYKTFLGQKGEPGPARSAGDPMQAHVNNWLDCIRTREANELNAPISTGHTSSGLAHLGNIAYRLNERLEFDPESEQFVNNPKADELLTRQYRAPFVVPEVV